MLQHPSAVDTQVGFQPFPADLQLSRLPATLLVAARANEAFAFKLGVAGLNSKLVTARQIQFPISKGEAS
jgi:hypothetical protein